MSCGRLTPVLTPSDYRFDYHNLIYMVFLTHMSKEK